MPGSKIAPAQHFGDKYIRTNLHPQKTQQGTARDQSNRKRGNAADSTKQGSYLTNLSAMMELCQCIQKLDRWKMVHSEIQLYSFICRDYGLFKTLFIDYFNKFQSKFKFCMVFLFIVYCVSI